MADLFETSDSDSEDEAAAAMEPVLSLSNPRNDAGFRPRSQTENSMHRQEEMNPRSTNALSSSSKVQGSVRINSPTSHSAPAPNTSRGAVSAQDLLKFLTSNVPLPTMSASSGSSPTLTIERKCSLEAPPSDQSRSEVQSNRVSQEAASSDRSKGEKPARISSALDTESSDDEDDKDELFSILLGSKGKSKAPREITSGGLLNILSDEEKKSDQEGEMIVEAEETTDETDLTPMEIADDDFSRLSDWPKLPQKPGKAEALLLGKLRDDDQVPYEVCANINAHLRDYQREGVQWLFDSYKKKMQGVILGDEMGLGKTIQVLAFLSAILRKTGTEEDIKRWKKTREERGRKQTTGEIILIIVPASLQANWKRECDTWCFFGLSTLDLKATRDAEVARILRGQAELVICSYETYKRLQGIFRGMAWKMVIFDEAHRLKNPKSQQTSVASGIKTSFRIGMTGTVMQNDLTELYCLLNLLAPGSLGVQGDFESYYAYPIKRARKRKAVDNPTLISIGKERAERLAKIIKKYHLRRTKNEMLLELSELGKDDLVVWCDLTPLQRRVYRRVLQMQDFRLVKKETIDTEGAIFWNRMHPDGVECDRCYSCIAFKCLNKLKLVSNHIELIKAKPSDREEKLEEDLEFIREALGEDLEELGGPYRDVSLEAMMRTDTCGKMEVFIALLNKSVRLRQKLLVFSCSVQLLDILERNIIREGHDYCRLDGNTPVSKRQDLVDRFNNNATVRVFLLSTTAGGLGLNLATAANVVIFDPNWNPSYDLQAQDRAYRMGQKQHVNVYRLVTRGTVEDHIYTRQIYKQQLSNVTLEAKEQKRLFDAVQGVKGEHGELFGFANLFELREEGVLQRTLDQHERDSEEYFLKLRTEKSKLNWDLWRKSVASKSALERDLDSEDAEKAALADLLEEGRDREEEGETEKHSQSKVKAKGSRHESLMEATALELAVNREAEELRQEQLANKKPPKNKTHSALEVVELSGDDDETSTSTPSAKSRPSDNAGTGVNKKVGVLAMGRKRGSAAALGANTATKRFQLYTPKYLKGSKPASSGEASIPNGQIIKESGQGTAQDSEDKAGAAVASSSVIDGQQTSGGCVESVEGVNMSGLTESSGAVNSKRDQEDSVPLGSFPVEQLKTNKGVTDLSSPRSNSPEDRRKEEEDTPSPMFMRVLEQGAVKAGLSDVKDFASRLGSALLDEDSQESDRLFALCGL